MIKLHSITKIEIKAKVCFVFFSFLLINCVSNIKTKKSNYIYKEEFEDSLSQEEFSNYMTKKLSDSNFKDSLFLIINPLSFYDENLVINEEIIINFDEVSFSGGSVKIIQIERKKIITLSRKKETSEISFKDKGLKYYKVNYNVEDKIWQLTGCNNFCR